MVLNNEIAFNVLKRKTRDRTGVDCSKYKDNYLKRRIDLRMKAIGIGPSYNEYNRFLEKKPCEYDALLDGITLNVTEFFRDSGVFDAFKNEVIPRLLSEKRKRNSKIVRI